MRLNALGWPAFLVVLSACVSVWAAVDYPKSCDGTDSMKVQGGAIIGQNGTPVNTLDVEGSAAIGPSYSGTETAPYGGLLVEGVVLIGRTTPRVEYLDMLDVQGGPVVVTDGTVDNILMINAGGVVGTRTNHDFRVVSNNTPRIFVASSGNVEVGGVGSADEKLHVRGNIKANGKIIADSVRVQRVIVNNWILDAPDYVFEPGYKLRPISEVEQHVKAHKHLPDVPSAAEMKNGVDLAEMNMALLKKVEELTLYVIQQQKQVTDQQKQISGLKAQMDVR